MREGIYQELKKQAKIKGFRPGKVPKSVIQAYYKEFIDDELKKKMVESTMGEALSGTDIRPVSEPRVEFFEGDDKVGYKMEIEVIPEIDLPAYEGIEVEVATVKVTDEEIARRIEDMREIHAQMVDKPGDHAAAKGDFVIIKYEATTMASRLRASTRNRTRSTLSGLQPDAGVRSRGYRHESGRGEGN